MDKTFIINAFIVLIWTFMSIKECSGSGNHSDYKHPDVEAERNHQRILGVCVGAGLACMFLVMLCISYNYYRNKPQPQKQDDEPAKPATSQGHVNPVMVQTPVYRPKPDGEHITQDTKF